MLGKTHKAGGTVAMLLSYMFMKQQGLLLNDIEPIIQLMVMYPACSWGSTASDLDQTPEAIPDKTPLSLALHTLLHMGKCRHRSWQTHSIAVTGGICIVLLAIMQGIAGTGLISPIGTSILRLIITGFTVGVFSHLLLDSVTMAGIWLVPKVHFRLVPPIKMFGTGTTYETIVRYALYGAIAVCLFVDLFVL